MQVAHAPSARLETWNRKVLNKKYDELLALFTAQQAQLKMLGEDNEQSKTILRNHKKATKQDQEAYSRIAPQSKEYLGDQCTTVEPPSNTLTPAGDPEDFRALFLQRDNLRAEVEQNKIQIRMQRQWIKDREADVDRLNEELDKHRALPVSEICFKECGKLRKKLCMLVKAIDFHGAAVRDATIEATLSLNCEDVSEARTKGKKKAEEEHSDEDAELQEHPRCC